MESRMGGACRSHPSSRRTRSGVVDRKEPWAQSQLLIVHSCHVNRRGSIPHFFQKNLTEEAWRMLKHCFGKMKTSFYPHKILIKNAGVGTGPKTKNQPHTLPSQWVGCDGSCHRGNSRKAASGWATTQGNQHRECCGSRWNSLEGRHLESLSDYRNTLMPFPRKSVQSPNPVTPTLGALS